MSRMLGLQDDLRFAAEEISKIAVCAIQTIERIYGSNPLSPTNPGFTNEPGYPVPPENSIIPVNSNFTNEPGYPVKEETSELEDPRFRLLEEVKISPVKEEPTKIESPKLSERPPRYDDGLNNLIL